MRIFISSVGFLLNSSPALFQTLVQLGGAIGLALTTVIADAYQTKGLAAGQSGPQALLSGLHAAFWLGGGCSLTALVLAAVTLRGMGTIGRGEKKETGHMSGPSGKEAVRLDKV